MSEPYLEEAQANSFKSVKISAIAITALLSRLNRETSFFRDVRGDISGRFCKFREFSKSLFRDLYDKNPESLQPAYEQFSNAVLLRSE